MRRIAFYGGTFDPIHTGHLAIAKILPDLFLLDRFEFLPAFHAPHKPDSKPTSEFHRFAMLSVATFDDPRLSVSTIELDHGNQRYTYETLAEIHKLYPDDRIFFVMGADSWEQITAWREWERVLRAADHIVVSRPGFELRKDHIGKEIAEHIVDLRGLEKMEIAKKVSESGNGLQHKIYFTNAVFKEVSATGIRLDASDGVIDNPEDIPPEVAKYIEKYELYR